MADRKPPPKAPVSRKITDALLSAKRALRDRLAPRVEQAVPQAVALRKLGGHRPAPEVNLVGVGIGEKVTAGKPTGELAVKVLVAKKYPRGRVRAAHRIPASIEGMPTDVQEVGYPRKFVIAQRQRHRPVPGGVSTGPSLQAAGYSFGGTLGVVVTSPGGGVRYALSNNHVLADENRVAVGGAILQPATLDDGRSTDRVASLTRYVPLKFDNKRNWMDAAIAKIASGVSTSKDILEIGPLSGTGAVRLNLSVRKSGRTTGLTEGIIRTIRFDVFDVEYDQGMIRIDDVMVIEGVDRVFSREGDSGSAIVDYRGRLVGLLFGGTDEVTFAIPIRRVLRRLGVRLAT